MRTRFLTVAVLLLQLGSVAGAGPKRLEGCPEPGDIASALAKLRDRGWTVWTPEELVKVWPRPLAPLDPQPQATSVLLGHKGRAGDWCECCETFHFDQESDGSGKGQQRLSAVIVFYSAERYADVVTVARLLAKAMGLPDSEGPIGQERPPPLGETVMQYFGWKETSLKKVAVLDLQISHDKLWTVYIRVGWHPGV